MIKKLFAILFGLFVLTSHAETYKIYIGVPTGGLTDVLMRRVVESAKAHSDDTLVIVNRPGADLLLAYKAMIEESVINPNVVYVSSTGSHVSSYYTYPEMKLDPINDTRSIVQLVKLNFNLIALKDAPYKTINDVSGKLNIGYSGTSSITVFNKAKPNKGDIELVMYKTESDIPIGLLKNEFHLGIANSINPQYIVNKDKLKVVAVMGQGGLGLSAPKSMSDEKVAHLNKIFNQALRDPGMVDWLDKNMDTGPAGGKPSDYDRLFSNFKQSIFGK